MNLVPAAGMMQFRTVFVVVKVYEWDALEERTRQATHAESNTQRAWKE